VLASGRVVKLVRLCMRKSRRFLGNMALLAGFSSRALFIWRTGIFWGSRFNLASALGPCLSIVLFLGNSLGGSVLDSRPPQPFHLFDSFFLVARLSLPLV